MLISSIKILINLSLELIIFQLQAYPLRISRKAAENKMAVDIKLCVYVQ